jgi:hypothetical protein
MIRPEEAAGNLEGGIVELLQHSPILFLWPYYCAPLIF